MTQLTPKRDVDSLPSRSLVRQSRKRKEQKTGLTVSRLFWIAIIALLFISAGFLFLNPFKLFAEQFGTTPEPTLLFNWLAFSGGTFWLGGLLLATAVFITWWQRWKARMSDPTYWSDACPSCSATALKRTKRTTIDHLMGRLGIPVRRYLCAECHWEGPRIDPNKI